MLRKKLYFNYRTGGARARTGKLDQKGVGGRSNTVQSADAEPAVRQSLRGVVQYERDGESRLMVGQKDAAEAAATLRDW